MINDALCDLVIYVLKKNEGVFNEVTADDKL